MKILVAEDDPVIATMMSHLLKVIGTCDVVANGQEAVGHHHAALDAGEPYDVVFLDVMMPVLDGHTALREIRKTEQDADVAAHSLAKIIMTSALDDKENVLRAFREQADAYLVKPINSGMIVAQMKKLGVLGR